MPQPPSIQALVAKLASSELADRVAALGALAAHGSDAFDDVVTLLRDEAADPFGRVWAIHALGPMATERWSDIVAVLLPLTDDPSPAVRWAALHKLGVLEADAAVPTIRRHLSDEGEVPGAWFEDDCRVSHAAAAALRRIGTEEAMRALAEHSPA